MSNLEINLESIYKNVSGSTAKLNDMEQYITDALKQAGEGNEITLTGAAPIWMYLKIAHALHGKATKLFYSAPGQGIDKYEIFNHEPN